MYSTVSVYVAVVQFVCEYSVCMCKYMYSTVCVEMFKISAILGKI